MGEGEAVALGFEQAMGQLGNLSDIIGVEKSVSLMIKNVTAHSTLYEPKVFPTSGKVFRPLANKIDHNQYVKLGFHKTPWGFRGANGVIVYKINEGRETWSLRIYYNVPLIGYNGFYLDWSKGESNADSDVCDYLYNNQWTMNGVMKWEHAHSNHHNADGYMSQTDKAHMIVEVSDRVYN